MGLSGNVSKDERPVRYTAVAGPLHSKVLFSAREDSQYGQGTLWAFDDIARSQKSHTHSC